MLQNETDYHTFYKTAHFLLSKHGDKIVENISAKIAEYTQQNDIEAVEILKKVEKAAQNLMRTPVNLEQPN